MSLVSAVEVELLTSFGLGQENSVPRRSWRGWPVFVLSIGGQKRFALTRVRQGKEAKLPASIALSQVLLTGYPAVAWE